MARKLGLTGGLVMAAMALAAPVPASASQAQKRFGDAGEYAFRMPRHACARVGGAVSAPVTVYAWPNVKFGKIRWAGRTHLRVTHRVTTPGTDLRGQRLVMYLDRRRTKSMTRIASAPLRRAGRWCTTATMRFRPPRKVGERDYLYVCVQGGLRRGLGAPTNLTRRCGARSIRE